MFLKYAITVFLTFASYLQADQIAAVLLPSTESDPDAFIDHAANAQHIEMNYIDELIHL